MLVIEVEFQVDGLSLLHPVESGNGESNAMPGNIANVNYAASRSGRLYDPVGPRQAGLFAVVTPEIKLDPEDGVAFAADFKGMFFMSK